MIESILHFLGLCPDNFSHPNILMMFSGAAGGWFGLKYLWHRIWHNKIAVVDTETRGLDGNAQILVQIKSPHEGCKHCDHESVEFRL